MALVNNNMTNNSNINNMAMPRIGIGTFFPGETDMKKICDAISLSNTLGYQHYDCAEVYQSTKSVGNALSSMAREKVWITTKLKGIPNNTDENYEDLKSRVEKQLELLGNVKYVDLLLIHFPGRNEVDLSASPEAVKEMASFDWFEKNIDQGWKNMIRLREDGLCRRIGISNFYKKHLDRLLQCPSVTMNLKENIPFANEIYIDPSHPEFKYVNYMQSLQIKVIAYRSFAFLPVIEMASQMGDTLYSKLNALKEKYGHNSIHETIINWLVQRNIYVLVKSISKDHLLENLNVVNIAVNNAVNADNQGDESENEVFCHSEVVHMCGGLDEYAEVFKTISDEQE
jgi:diketogulonate reductase-like aldo/keto reductase